MRHVILTCKNHPELRWSTKKIAFSPEANNGQGGYNGTRHIFFIGELTGDGMYPDLSGLHCATYFPERADPIVAECQCNACDLIRAPEDHLVRD